MTRVIAGVYEIHRQIGSGGGGIVYLGRHLRLDKQVVLKADKRTLDTKPEALRREVDMLKDASHRYIPQVYDFIQEDGVVYTVMDFIEGESLDRLLARGKKPGQPQVIKWACQLLEALGYLHSRPPHGILHGDIKPANIMLRPDGDICLIDYNIALALGEDGAVKVGYSRGYASPEHYSADYTDGNRTTAFTTQTLKDAWTTQTAAEASPASGGSGRNGKNTVLLDVRSDIYSLGATLYHLLSGQRPAQDAGEVKPLSAEVCSPQIAAVIQKAMEPDPARRYQSADEMLAAFRRLHRNDRRYLRHKRRMMASAAILTALFLVGGICAFVGLKQLEQIQTALALAEYSSGALRKGDVSGAVRLALEAIPRGDNILEGPVTAQARKALTDALGVYDLSDGFKALGTADLPSAPLKFAVSPEGTCFAVVYAYEAVIFDMANAREIIRLPLFGSALSDVVFADETHLVYAGADGVTGYDLETQSKMWTGETAATLAVSGDGKVAAAAGKEKDCAAVYRMSDGKKLKECSFQGRRIQAAANDIFADPMNGIFALNEDGSLLAVSFPDGGLTLFDLSNPDNSTVLLEESDYVRFEGGFCGPYFAFAACKSSESYFGMADTVKNVYMDGYTSRDTILLKAGGDGVFLAEGDLLIELDPVSLEETELAYTHGVKIIGFTVGNGYALIAGKDHSFSFYDSGAHLLSTETGGENCDFTALAGKYAVVGNRNEPSVRFLELEDHGETQVLSYDARYPHDEARVSRDGQTVMLFDYQGFRVYDMEGRMVKEAKLPDAGGIYDQQFVRDGRESWLEVTWYDGMERRYSAADGSLLSEAQGEPPPADLYEEFYTEKYRIASSLHAAPEVYELETGRLAAVLQEEAYLTYVTQSGEYLITEYISAAGERYGLLLDEDFQVTAYLPGLCDVMGDKVFFDYDTGDLRQCRLYSLEELIALGEAKEG